MNLALLFLEAAERHPDRVALLHAETRFTYAQIAAQSRGVSRLLRETFQIVPGTRVGLWLHNRPEFIPALLGALHAGAVVVPINSFLKPE